MYDRQEDQIRIIQNECCRSPTAPACSRAAGRSRWSRRGGAVADRGQPRYVVLDVTFRLAAAGAVRAGEVRRAGGRARRRRWGSRRASARSAPPCSRSAPARAWCSTPATRTPAARAPSSPTRCITAGELAAVEAAAAARGAGQVPRYDAGDGLVKVPGRLADRARRLRQGLRRPRPGARLLQAHPRPGQRGQRDHRRPARAGPRDRLRRPRRLRRHPDPGTDPHRRHPLARSPCPALTRCVSTAYCRPNASHGDGSATAAGRTGQPGVDAGQQAGAGVRRGGGAANRHRGPARPARPA